MVERPKMNYHDAIQQLQSSRDFLNHKLRSTGRRDVLLEDLVVMKSIHNLRKKFEDASN